MEWQLVRLIVTAMDAKDWSEADLARESDVTQSTINRILRGVTSEVTWDVAERLAAALELDPKAIIAASAEQMKAIRLAGPGGVPGRPPFRPRRRRGARGRVPLRRLRVATRARTVRVDPAAEEESAGAGDGAPGRGGDVGADAPMPAWFRPYAEKIARLEQRLEAGNDPAESDTTRPWWRRSQAA